MSFDATNFNRSFPRNTLANVETFICVADVAELLFKDLSPANLLRLARCSKKIYHAVLAYIDRAFNIDKHLSQFFSNPTSFRTLQARTNTLISGSAALQFFNRTRYEGSDLDIYTPIQHQLEVGDWLIREGYEYRAARKQLPTFKEAALFIVGKGDILWYTWRGVGGIFDFFRMSASGVEDKVQMMVATNSPMEVVLSFHSTCVMNVISYDTAYSLYPRETFEEHRALVCSSPGPSQEPALIKYRGRGWTFLEELTARDQYDHRSSFRIGYRWIDDDKTWIIPLNTERLLIPNNHPLDPCTLTNWKLEYDEAEKTVVFQTTLLAMPRLLKNNYIVTDPRILEGVRKLLKRRLLRYCTLYDDEIREDCRTVAKQLALARLVDCSSLSRFHDGSAYMIS